jgi:transcriptional regulator with XRE-family HTH domain
MEDVQETAGQVLREWRRRRRLSQLDLALEASISSRHLSFVESGRSRGSREVLLQLSERLGMPPRARNRLLMAGGYAPAFPEHRPGAGTDEPFEAAISIIEGHMPFPALAVDRHWNLVRANGALAPLLVNCSHILLSEPINVLRLSLHPDGLAPMIINLAEWRHHILERLRQQVETSGDPGLATLQGELLALPGPKLRRAASHGNVVPLQLRLRHDRVLNLISATTIFGTATELTLSELMIESFFPADAATRAHFLEQSALPNA